MDGRARLLYLLLGAGANCLWGTYAPLSRALQAGEAKVPPIALLLVLSAIAFSTFSIYFLGVKRIGFAWVRKKQVWLMASLVLVRAISNIVSTGLTAPLYSVLVSLLAPFVVALLSRFWLKDSLPPFTWLALVLTLGGTLMTLLGGGGDNSQLALTWRDAGGIGLQVVSTVAYATYIVCVKRHRGLGEPVIIVSQSLLVFAVGTPLSFAVGEDWTAWARLSGRDVGLLLFFGVGVFTVGAASQIVAISKLGSAALVSVFLPLRLVVAIVLSLFIVDDAPLAGALQICGTVLVLATLAAYLVANRSVAAAERYEKAIVRTARQCACWARRRTDGEEEEDAEEGEEEERAAVELAAVAPVAQAMIVETDVARENTQ